VTSVVSIKNQVRDFYRAHPFPQWTREERRRKLGAELSRYRFLGLEDAMKGARFLDVGCGTGNRSMLAAKQLGVREFVGLDQSESSLAIARQVAEEEQFDRFTPMLGDVLQIPYPDACFDVVVSWGVLHHTGDAFRGLSEMVRVCRPGGFIGVYLYNRFDHWRHDLRREKVIRLAGDDIEQRFWVAHRLYGSKPVDAMSTEELIAFYDEYCHPHETSHTLGETLEWFLRLGLSYRGSYPPLRFKVLLEYLQFRATLLNEHPASSHRLNQMARLTLRLPRAVSNESSRRPPTVLHRFMWQAWWTWRGRQGGYSGGASLSARK